MSIDADIRLAKLEIEIAENRFNNAVEKKDVDFAITQLMEAEERLTELNKKKKEGMKSEKWTK